MDQLLSKILSAWPMFFSEPELFGPVLIPILIFAWLAISWIKKEQIKGKDSTIQSLRSQIETKNDRIRGLEKDRDFYKTFHDAYKDQVERQSSISEKQLEEERE